MKIGITGIGITTNITSDKIVGNVEGPILGLRHGRWMFRYKTHDACAALKKKYKKTY